MLLSDMVRGCVRSCVEGQWCFLFHVQTASMCVMLHIPVQ